MLKASLKYSTQPGVIDAYFMHTDGDAIYILYLLSALLSAKRGSKMKIVYEYQVCVLHVWVHET